MVRAQLNLSISGSLQLQVVQAVATLGTTVHKSKSMKKKVHASKAIKGPAHMSKKKMKKVQKKVREVAVPMEQ